MSLLIRSVAPPDFSGQHWVPTRDPGIYLGDGLSPSPVGATIIERDGLVVNEAEYLAIRPLGNESGKATGPLLYQHFMGAPQRVMTPAATDPVAQAYPAGNLPFEIEIRHHYFNTPATPVSTGWGFRCEIVGGASSRDPTARSTGCATDGTYTTWRWPALGAFIQGPSAWQVDAQGQPLTVWYQNSWDGYRRPTKETWYVALLVGPTPEGKATLPVDRDGVIYQFWAHDQGYVAPPAATWVDTGATIIAQAGTAYQLSATLTGLSINQPLRLGPTVETKFNGYWPTVGTPSAYILTSPFQQVAVGTKVWKWA